MELGHYYLLKRKPNLMERLYEVIIPLSLGGFPLDLLPVAVEEAGTLEVKSHPQTHLGPEDPLAPPPSADDVSRQDGAVPEAPISGWWWRAVGGFLHHV